MVTEIFITILFPSLAGACLSAVILLLRPLTRKAFGYAWHYYIWLAVLITMLLPVRFSVIWASDAIPAVSPVIQSEQIAQVQNPVAPAPLVKPEENLLQAGASFIKSVGTNRMNIIAYVWLTGAVVLLSIHLAGYAQLITKMRKTSTAVSCPQLAAFTKRNVAVRTWENASSPFLVGIVRPILILPAREFTDEQLNNILRHEMMHLKRCDILYKWAAVFVKCLHWFNPMIWVAAKQINTECEISCDMAVTRNLSRDEEISYIDTLLSLLPTDKTRQFPLTTQMASSKKILKRRFLMMKTKKATSKFVSVLSAVIALAMLSTTVFASGVLSGLNEEDYTVEITNNGEVIGLVNKPFIENGEVYMPLRETFEKIGVMEHPESKIEWNDGKIDLCIAYYADGVVTTEHQQLNSGHSNSVSFIFNCSIEIGKSVIIENTEPNLIGQDISSDMAMNSAPILKGSNTYIPYSYINRILTTQKWQIGYIMYDKNGNEIALEEVAAAKAVIEEYYRAGNTKDRAAQLATLTQRHHAPNVLLSSDDKSIITIKDIRYSPSDSIREAEDYIKYGNGSVNGTQLENVIVFYMDYDVSFPEGISDQENGAWASSYDNWKMILIRDNKDGKWLIDDMGF